MSRFNIESMRARHPDLELSVSDVPGASEPNGGIRIELPAAHARTLLGRLVDEAAEDRLRLVDLTAIDRGATETTAGDALEVVYRLRSDDGAQALHVYARIDDPKDSSGGVEGSAPDEERGDDCPPAASSTPTAPAMPIIDSVSALWPVANWLEREVFDLFGIRFRGHPDLRRLLLDEAFEGAPLRKQHPLALDRALPVEEPS